MKVCNIVPFHPLPFTPPVPPPPPPPPKKKNHPRPAPPPGPTKPEVRLFLYFHMDLLNDGEMGIQCLTTVSALSSLDRYCQIDWSIELGSVEHWWCEHSLVRQKVVSFCKQSQFFIHLPKGWSNDSDGFLNPYTVRISRTPPTHPQILTSDTIKSVHFKNNAYIVSTTFIYFI